MERITGLLKDRRSKILFKTALVVYTVILTYYSLIPQSVGDVPTAGFSMYDLHLMVYLGMSILALLSFPESVPSSTLFVLSSVFAYGFAIEIVQIPIPGRFFSWYDVLMNGVGSFLPFLAVNSTIYNLLRNYNSPIR